MHVHAWIAAVIWLAVSTSASATCPPIEIEPIAPTPQFERLVAAYSVTTATTAARWVLLVGRDATVNADGAPDSYDVEDHGISYLCDGMCVRRDGHCRVGAICSAVSARLRHLQVRDGALLVTCEPPFEALRDAKFFGFLATPTLAGGYTDCGKTRIPFASQPDGRRFLTPQTALTFADASAIPSQTVPFIVRPRDWNASVPASLRFNRADAAWVVAPFRDDDLVSPALVGDTGPAGVFGEGSIALHQRLTHGELIEPPAYARVPGQRHPEVAKIPLPYRDHCDGDIRAKVSASGPWWYLISPGSADSALSNASDSTELLDSLDQRLVLRGEHFGGIACLRKRLHAAGIATNPDPRPSPADLFGRIHGRCGR